MSENKITKEQGFTEVRKGPLGWYGRYGIKVDGRVVWSITLPCSRLTRQDARNDAHLAMGEALEHGQGAI